CQRQEAIVIPPPPPAATAVATQRPTRTETPRPTATPKPFSQYEQALLETLHGPRFPQEIERWETYDFSKLIKAETQIQQANDRLDATLYLMEDSRVIPFRDSFSILKEYASFEVVPSLETI